jgi:hypothetical protein
MDLALYTRFGLIDTIITGLFVSYLVTKYVNSFDVFYVVYISKFISKLVTPFVC